jgi:hypothetical protein
LKPVLVEGEEIEIPFHNDHLVFFRHRPLGHVEAIKDLSFVIDGRLWRVEILRFPFFHNPSAESNDPLIEVKDRKKNPSPEGVIPTLSLLGKDEADFPGHLERKFFPLEVLDQSVPSVKGVTQSVFTDDLLPDATLRQIPPCILPFLLMGEEIMVILGGSLVDLEEDISFGKLLFLAGRQLSGRKFYPVTLGQHLHSLGK